MTVEDELRRSLAREASRLTPGPDRWGDIERQAALARNRRRTRIGGLTAVALVAASLLVFLAIPALVKDDAERQTVTADQAPSPVTTSPETSDPDATPPTTAAPTAAPVGRLPLPVRQNPSHGYELLWPFASLEEAQQWQDESESAGHSPWHSDHEATALFFSSGYLGYTGIDRVISSSVIGPDARVTVGYHDDAEGNRDFPAAVIHLVRLGTGEDGPWEVVGTDDAQFSITTPAYSDPVKSPLTVGGIISGVDESLHLQVRTLSAPERIGDSCCSPAGGERTPWSMAVSFTGARPGEVLTVAVSTGGHLAEVERFAVTGVRAWPE